MSTDRPARLSALFREALAREPSTRESFLDEACRDDQGLRRELERLLAGHAEAGSFLQEPVGALANDRLAPGTRLGSYSVTAFIGAGGMGEVYRARDPRLGRDVAIKLLPADEAGDDERRARFAREARAIAALNHPNIVTIHSIEESEGRHFLTMELVPGKTLRELLPPNGLPIDRLLDMAIPLADAIGTAHGHGIVHRDLKPANVMVTPDGRVKVLDFGLAKLKAPEDLRDSTALASAATKDGQLVGTVAYMSPEQAEGRELDSRTDIFSLGVLLFELATGQRPFKGDSNVSLLSSILKDVPPSVTELRPELPPELGRLIRRCLAKDPNRRYQSALDLRNDLEDLHRDAEVSATSAKASGPAAVSIRQWFPRAWLAVGLVVVAGAAAVAVSVWRTSRDDAPVERLRTTLQPPLGVQIAQQSAPPILAISPDGRQVAFLGAGADPKRRGLYLRSVDALESRFVRDGSSPFFSPDGNWLGFWADNVIWKMPVAGGQLTPVCKVPDELRGASWGDDGTIVFSATIGDKKGMLWRVPASGGEPAPITTPGASRHFFPHVLPGSRAALVMSLGDGPQNRTVAVVSLETGAIVRRLVDQGSTPQYNSDGLLLYRWLETVYAVPFDVERLDITGKPQAVLTGVSYNTGGSETSGFAVSRTGALVYTTAVAPPDADDAELAWLDSRGVMTQLATERQNYRRPALDPSGRRVAVHIGRAGASDLSVYTIATRKWMQLTTGLRTYGPIVWTPAGGSVIFSAPTGSGPSFIPSLYRVQVEGGGREPERLTHQGSGSFSNPYDFANSVYRNVLLFHRQTGSGQVDLFTLRLEPLGTPEPLLVTKVLTENGAISPDGRWVAYQSAESGGRQVFVRSFSSPARNRWPVADDGIRPHWSRDGRRIFFFRDREIWSVAVSPTATDAEFRAGTPELVIRNDFIDPAHVTTSADPTRFVIVKRPQTERLLVHVPNFGAEARQSLQSRERGW